MLLTTCKHSGITSLLVLLMLVTTWGCKSESSSETSVADPYLADYEKPAQPWGFIDRKGNLAIPADYDAVSLFGEGKAAVCIDGKWGFIDHQAAMVIQPQYQQAWSFHHDRARVKPFDQPDHFIDPAGGIIRSADWTAADDFSEGLAKVRYGELYGFIDTSGAIVINPDYTRAWNFENGVAIVEKDGKVGVINQQGTLVIKARFDNITRNLARDRLLAHEGVKSIMYSLTGKELLQLAPVKMLDADSFNVMVKRGELKWLYNLSKRNWLGDHGYIQLLNLGQSHWAAKSASGYQILDKNGTPVNAQYYSQVNRFNEGIAAFQRGDYWSYVNVDGVELGEPAFGLAWDFKEGLARAAFRDGIAFITSDQQLAFYPPENTVDLRDFAEGLAPVQLSGR